jgi:hypothetical protein
MTATDTPREQALKLRAEMIEAEQRALGVMRQLFRLIGIVVALSAVGEAALVAVKGFPAVVMLSTGGLTLAIAVGLLWYASTLTSRSDLLASGLQAQVRLVEMLGTYTTNIRVLGVSTTTGLYRSRWRVAVTAPGHEPYTLVVTQFAPDAPSRKPGEVLTAYVDRQRRTRIFVDWTSGSAGG